jgi:hypothetical protein
MRSFLSALPLLATTMLFAQAPRPFTMHHVYPLDGWSCPVGMTAQQQASGATQGVVSLEDSREPAAQARPPMRLGDAPSVPPPNLRD